MRRLRITSAAIALLFAVVGSAPLASAQPAAPVTIPPRMDPLPSVAFPEGAHGDAEVILVLVVADDGSVRSAEVEAGDEPFASAAKEAALRWHFEPGTRDGKPISAKIRFGVSFREPPPPEPEPAPPDKPKAATPREPPKPKRAAPPPATGSLEVTVEGERPAPAASTLSRGEVRRLPGAFGDPFRAIETLPGVTPIVSGVPYFYVRGAPPGNVGYYLDGVRVPYLYHVAVGPSVIHPAMVERVDLYPGGYPARFGRYAGAIVSAETTAPRTDWHGEGNVRVFDAGAMLEGGFADGKGTALVGGRYSYTGAVISLISPEVRLDYRDYQLRVTYDLTARDRIGLFAFGAYDLLAQEKNGIESVAFGSEFYRADLRYDHALGKGGNIRWAATVGFDQTRVGEQRNARDLLSGMRVELTRPIDEKVTARGGVDVEFDGYEADTSRYSDPDDPETTVYNDLFPPRTDAAASVWTDVVWKVDRRVEVTPGLRLDVYSSSGASAVSLDPRLALRVDASEHVRLIHAIGVTSQPPSFIIPIPGLAVGSLRGGLQHAFQASSGVEMDLPYAVTASVTVFDNVFFDMTDVLGVETGDRDDLRDTPRALGSAYGLEIYVRRRLTKQLGGFLSYTLSRSTRTLGGLTFPATFDRTHVLNTALSYDFGRGYSAGARFTFYTGAPAPPETPAGQGAPPPGTWGRDPVFYRIDARLEKRWKVGTTGWVSFVIEMLNATLHKETIGGEPIGPVSIPSIGVEGGF